MRAALRTIVVLTALLASAASVPALAAPDTVGVVDQNTGVWSLRDGAGDTFTFYYGNPGDVPFAGDWNCDGTDTPGLYRQSDGFVYLRNSNSQGNADITFFFGNPGDIPIAGDFNNNGCDTVSIYRPSESRVFIINELGENGGGLGAAELDYYFGNPGDTPFTGDFDNDGTDTVGLYRQSTGSMYFRNSHTQGNADFDFFYGNPGDRFVGGDWTDDGTDTPGVFRPSDAFFYLKHTNTQGNADEAFGYGNANSSPVAGRWGDIPAIRHSWPFGPFFPPDESWGERFSGGLLNLTTKTAIRDLEMVRAAGASVVIDFHGKKHRHQNPDETFNLEMWKARIDTFVGLGLESYITDGTILAHYMTDEPKSRGSWGGEVIPNDVIDEMARYSKSIWPTLATTVRVSPSKLARHAGGYDIPLPDWEWRYLDIGWAQYSARFGSVTEYAAVEVAEAERQGLGLIFGLNVIDGGDGSSGIEGNRSGKWSMSPQELLNYGATLISTDKACAFLMWRYDWNDVVYFERPEIAAAVAELAMLAGGRTPTSCVP